MNAFNNEGNSPLYNAIVNSKVLTTEILIEEGADTTLITKGGKSAVDLVREQSETTAEAIKKLVYDSVFVISYTINDDGLISSTPNYLPIRLKVNQKITLEPTFHGEAYERVLINSEIMDFQGPYTIRAVSKGKGTVTIIPFAYDWDKAKEYQIIIE